MIDLLMTLLFLVILFYIAKIACDFLGAPPAVLQIVGLVLLLYFLSAVIGFAPAGPPWRLRW
jgi:uncharacterized membrane protein YbhN (UPF0104 family)